MKSDKLIQRRPFCRNTKVKIQGAQQAAKGISGVDATANNPQAAFIAVITTKSYSYSLMKTGEMKNEEAMNLGIKRSKDVLYNMYRTGVLSQKTTTYIAYDIKQDFTEQCKPTAKGYLYHCTPDEDQCHVRIIFVKR